MGAYCFQIKCAQNQLIGIIVFAVDWHIQLQCFLCQSAPKKIYYGGMWSTVEISQERTDSVIIIVCKEEQQSVQKTVLFTT